MFEKRLTDILIKYWTRLKGDDDIPHIEAFNSNAVGEVWEQCFQVSVLPHTNSSGFQFMYDYFGSELVIALEHNPTGKHTSSRSGYPAEDKIFKKLEIILADPQAEILEGKFINKDNKVVKFRCCILPLSLIHI